MRRRRFRMPRSLRATRAGWCFVAIVFGVGFAALNTGNNLLYLVLSLLLAFLVLSGLLSESSLRGIRLERRLPRELFANAPNRISLRIHNDLGRTPSFAISIEDLVEEASGLAQAGRCFVLRVGARDTVDRSYNFEPSERGELTFSTCRLSTRFPFGLFVKSVDIDLDSRALVYPAVFPLPESSKSGGAIEESGQRRNTALEGDVLSSVREYVPGDSVRRIHWRRSLRTRRLIVGEREGESSAQIEVVLALPQGLIDPEVESRISRATSEVLQHLESGLEVGLRTTSTRFPPNCGFGHRTELLSFLARVHRDSEEDARDTILSRSVPPAIDRITDSPVAAEPGR